MLETEEKSSIFFLYFFYEKLDKKLSNESFPSIYKVTMVKTLSTHQYTWIISDPSRNVLCLFIMQHFLLVFIIPRAFKLYLFYILYDHCRMYEPFSTSSHISSSCASKYIPMKIFRSSIQRRNMEVCCYSHHLQETVLRKPSFWIDEQVILTFSNTNCKYRV